MKEQHAELFERIAHILLPHDYLNYWLTGRCTSEYGDASGTGYFNVRSRQWDYTILRQIDPTGRLEAALPELIEPYQPAGRIHPELAAQLGLNPQALVASGGGTMPAKTPASSSRTCLYRSRTHSSARFSAHVLPSQRDADFQNFNMP